jgi:hypothetical protein
MRRGVLDSSIIHKPFSITKCQTLISRFATFSSLQVDVEGLDLAMLRSFDLRRHGALFLQYEWVHLGPERTAQAREYVQQAGYEAVVAGFDVVAVNERWLREGCAAAPTKSS